MIKNLVKLGIGFGIILYLIYIFDFRAVINAISGANPFFLMLSLLVYSLTFLILTARWKMVLYAMGMDIPLSKAYGILAGGVLLSDITPSRLGEFTRPFLARRYIDTVSGLASVVFDKYVDVSTVLFMSGWGLMLLYFKGIVNSYLLVLFSGLLLIFSVGSVLLWTKRKKTIVFIKKICFLFRISPSIILEKFDESMRRINNPVKLLVLCLFITFFAWVTSAIRVLTIGMAIGFYLPFTYLVFLLPLVAVLSRIPVSISGLGFVEAGMAVLLSLFGVPLYAGISIAVLDRSITVFFHVLAGSRYALNW